MPTFTFTSPEGKNYDVEGPEGATKEQAFGILQQKLGKSDAPAAPAPAAPEQSKLEQVPGALMGTAKSLIEPVMAMGSGMIAKPASDVAGLAAIPAHAAGLTKQEPGPVKEAVQRGMTYEPTTGAGKAIAEYNPLAILGKMIGWGAEKGSQLGAPPPSKQGPVESVARGGIKELLEQIPGLLGAKGGAKLAERIPAKQAALDIAKAKNAPLDAIREQSQSAGLTTPPEGTSWLAGIPGIQKLDRWISGKNQPEFNRLIADQFDLPKGTALSDDVLKGVRSKAGETYKEMVESGGEALPSTPEFKAKLQGDLAEIEAKLKASPETFGSLKPSARLLREYAKKDAIEPRMAMDSIKQLRSDATTNFKSTDPSQRASGYTRMEIANGIEDLFEANLQATGRADLLTKFREARKTIAQSYDVEKVIDASGNVDAQKLARISQRRPLSENLKIVSDYAETFPKGAKKVTEGKQAFSPFDWMFMVGAGPVKGALELAGRVGVPYAAEKGWMQKKTPSYEASSLPPNIARILGIGTSSESQQLTNPPQQ